MVGKSRAEESLAVEGMNWLASIRVCDTVLVVSGAAVEAARVVEFWDEFARCILLDAPARK